MQKINISKDDLYNYYISENHTCRECLDYFCITHGYFYSLTKKYGITKDVSERLERSRSTCLNKYGVENPFSAEGAVEKIKQTKLKRHGDENYNNLDKHKKTCMDRYGVTNIRYYEPFKQKSHSKAALAKCAETKRKNKSFRTSKQEDEYYIKLVSEFGANDVIRQYKDDRYPFACDFYIKSIDKFIELNLHWSHGKRPFDERDSSCLAMKLSWEEKAKTSKYYKNALVTWTVRDPLKIKTANDNNLNYEVIYSLES